MTQDSNAIRASRRRKLDANSRTHCAPSLHDLSLDLELNPSEVDNSRDASSHYQQNLEYERKHVHMNFTPALYKSENVSRFARKLVVF
ncbi:hypothetical protein HNY73_006663 [Argiope bruennichi]|uniref:Uncharacterized protein n=1 Tax=Argiope bruennichi TaxID=94029 RepID=A0A8T0FE90_ARGBR|nr:hypothetical protein HNY73_006663 [Argiope bruennichi]